MNGLAGCSVSTIGKPHEYFDLTGKRFLMIKEDRSEEAEPTQLILVQNWLEERKPTSAMVTLRAT